MEQYSRQRYEAYKAFMRRHHKAVWRVCYDFAQGNIHQCEDLVQEVWIMVWLKFDLLREDASEWQQRMWVRKVTRNVIVDLYRKEKQPEEPITAEMEETIATDDSDVAERIDELMASLNPDERRLMRMRLDGYSPDEIAAVLGIERNAVYQRVNRIMTKLKRKYGTRL